MTKCYSAMQCYFIDHPRDGVVYNSGRVCMSVRKFGNRLALHYWLSLALVSVSVTGRSAVGSISVTSYIGRISE